MADFMGGATEILDKLSRKIVGQPAALAGISSTVKTYLAGLAPLGRPAGVFLLLGPTGTGKTRTVEALAEVLHGTAAKVVKVNCGEFQTDHEVAKLIGSPPGYLGHRETKAILTQERLSEAVSAECDLSIVLFDEIEKAAPTVSQLLLGVLDKATLRLGDNTEVNFEKALIFLTSNLGAREMMRELQPDLGFRPQPALENAEVTGKLEGIALNAVRRMYSPEFVNRIDVVVTYKPLDSEALDLILDQQIEDLQQHVNSRLADKCFNIEVSENCRALLLQEGASPQYGARELKRAIHRRLTQPLANLLLEGKIAPGSTVRVLLGKDRSHLEFETAGTEFPSSRPTVLIVDDNRDFLRLLSMELTNSTTWNVRTAQSLSEAEGILAAGMIHFALLDLFLQDANGIDLGVKLRKIDSSIQVAIMTGSELTHLEAHLCRKYGFDVIHKPFLPQQIVELVKDRVMKRKARGTA